MPQFHVSVVPESALLPLSSGIHLIADMFLWSGLILPAAGTSWNLSVFASAGGLLTVWSLQGLEGSSSPGLHLSSSNSCADYELLKPAYQGPPRFQASWNSLAKP